MDWQRFEDEDLYWQKILELLNDRITIIDEDLRDPEKTKDIIELRMLQQERRDIEFMIAVPNIFKNFPSKEEVKNGHLDEDSQ
jgi:hypothetical protein